MSVSLTSVAELSDLLCVASILVCTCLMLIVMLRRAGGGGAQYVPISHAPNKLSVSKVSVPVSVQLKRATIDSGVQVELHSDSKQHQQQVYLRLFVCVDISIFHHVLRGPWPWFKEAFLRGNLFGSQGCAHMSQIQTVQMVDGKVTATLDTNSDVDIDLGNGTPRQKYPLVLCTVTKSEIESQDCQDNLRVGAVLNVIHVKDDVCTIPTQILSTHLKHVDGRVTNLEQIFVSNNDEDTSECSVCQDRRVCHVFFPCRHACVCSRCFRKIKQKCPMCRTNIEAFFNLEDKVLEELTDEEEEEVTPDLSWGQRLVELNHRYAMAMGLRENE